MGPVHGAPPAPPLRPSNSIVAELGRSGSTLLAFSLMRNSYRRLANEFVTQLEIVDNLVPETTQLHERQKSTENSQFELSKTRVA